ncbi:hypothetical protein NLJ89_g5383 [Agrocybe chaxingu]|uniref:GSKIP domain-containing protein n=1 Tax=Agrocybe chaxingu TaxID=84603 RepID=A0A9W8MWZ1_9AGAR|nr:hypothetical protein NLJ89_g5383 [Agrocybe chaxingu]
MPGSASSPTSFYAGELQRALKEQAFGIKAFTMGATSSQQATASVVLLEGHHLVIRLTTQGYTITNSSSASTGARVYETVDDLLQLSSPMYVKKRQETLMAALAKLS